MDRGVEQELIEMIKKLYEGTRKRVKIWKDSEAFFWLGRGLR